MKKTRTKHYVGAALVGLMLATCSVSVIGAQVKELTTQRVNLEQIQNELQTMLITSIWILNREDKAVCLSEVFLMTASFHVEVLLRTSSFPLFTPGKGVMPALLSPPPTIPKHNFLASFSRNQRWRNLFNIQPPLSFTSNMWNWYENAWIIPWMWQLASGPMPLDLMRGCGIRVTGPTRTIPCRLVHCLVSRACVWTLSGNDPLPRELWRTTHTSRYLCSTLSQYRGR